MILDIALIKTELRGIEIMATYEKAKSYAKDSANRKKQPYLIKQSQNGQWLFTPNLETSAIENKFEIVYPDNRPHWLK